MAGIYQELKKAEKEIRLLLVSSGGEDEPVECSFRYVSLLEKPETAYETISYVWGDSAIRGLICIDGTWLDVPASSERVLRRMRYSDHDRTLWIDAVCINQANVQERNQQVAMMDEVYSKTVLNLIWLGESTAQTERAISTIQEILDDARKETDNLNSFLETVYDTETLSWDYSDHGFQFSIDNEPLLQFFTLPWFRRLWGKSWSCSK
jgi:hypothetical protein